MRLAIHFAMMLALAASATPAFTQRASNIACPESIAPAYDLANAIGGKPSDAIALSRRGQAREALGQTNQALDDFRAALEANPQLDSAEEGFARIMAQQQRSDGAGK